MVREFLKVAAVGATLGSTALPTFAQQYYSTPTRTYTDVTAEGLTDYINSNDIAREAYKRSQVFGTRSPDRETRDRSYYLRNFLRDVNNGRFQQLPSATKNHHLDCAFMAFKQTLAILGASVQQNSINTVFTFAQIKTEYNEAHNEHVKFVQDTGHRPYYCAYHELRR